MSKNKINTIIPFKLPNIETYFGGKGASGTYQKIINEIRPHSIRIIPFLGNCAITRHMKPCRTIVGLDLSKTVIGAWQDAPILENMLLLNECGIDFLERLPQFISESQKYVMYLDPPYPLSSKKQSRLDYDFNMTDDDHKRMLSAVLQLHQFDNVDILISTYPNQLYEDFYQKNGWELYAFQSNTRHGLATEWLLMNYSNPEGLLHDYSYLGEDYRERERIKIKIERFKRKMMGLPPKHRQAIIQSLNK